MRTSNGNSETIAMLACNEEKSVFFLKKIPVGIIEVLEFVYFLNLNKNNYIFGKWEKKSYEGPEEVAFKTFY